MKKPFFILLIFIFIYRDSVVSTLRTICALKGFALAARKSGKLKAVIQGLAAFAILILMILQSTNVITLETLNFYSTWLVAIAGIYTAFSAIDYIYVNRHYIHRLLVQTPET